jgi:hypothetical protein
MLMIMKMVVVKVASSYVYADPPLNQHYHHPCLTGGGYGRSDNVTGALSAESTLLPLASGNKAGAGDDMTDEQVRMMMMMVVVMMMMVVVVVVMMMMVVMIMMVMVVMMMMMTVVRRCCGWWRSGCKRRASMRTASSRSE